MDCIIAFLFPLHRQCCFQGPNYILAKRIQHWRAVIARNDQKCVVSSNIAPSTGVMPDYDIHFVPPYSKLYQCYIFWLCSLQQRFRLQKIARLHGPTVACTTFVPWKCSSARDFHHHIFIFIFIIFLYFVDLSCELLRQETSNAVMTALLLNDISSSSSSSHPDMPLANPLQLFTENSFHGGPWRTAHKFNTIGVPSALLYFLAVLVRLYLGLYNTVQVRMTLRFSFCFHFPLCF
jgi:hypothetical protein